MKASLSGRSNRAPAPAGPAPPRPVFPIPAPLPHPPAHAHRHHWTANSLTVRQFIRSWTGTQEGPAPTPGPEPEPHPNVYRAPIFLTQRQFK
ncbi:hypothetical protein Stsp01_42710 [Streptomyces sp. NBRC 13847]|nr:hypothetical protein Stsp01_42710 [Streptomyces sp. NBRC 13847]